MKKNIDKILDELEAQREKRIETRDKMNIFREEWNIYKDQYSDEYTD